MTTTGFEILIATHNAGKIREVSQALQSLPVRIRYLHEFANIRAVDEVGLTYQENAALKALGYAEQTGLCALADDSGLEVEVLGGKPGIYSARFGGEGATDKDRNQKLLEELSQQADHNRTARFVCCMAFAGWPRGRESVSGTGLKLLNVSEASCEGAITFEPKGTNGFGFDPLFVPAGYVETFSELPDEVKANISHRAKALSATRAFLDRWLVQT
jgi:XTP/dITP diphosphohydrolase